MECPRVYPYAEALLAEQRRVQCGCRLVSYDARRIYHASPHHLEDPYVIRPEVGREVAPRDFGAR